MDENMSLLPDELIQSDSGDSEVHNSVTEDEEIMSNELPSDLDVERSEDLNLPGNELDNTESENEELTTEEEEEEDTPKDTVIQVVENPDSESGYDIVGLDVEALNRLTESYSEINQLQTVNPTSNDYYSFIEGDVLEYFQGIMANKPMNEYRACHLRHWIQNTQYYSYYDDYYYLWYDYEHSLDYIELIKYNGQSNYVVNSGNGALLNASIMYGSQNGLSDFRKGVSYVQEMALLCSVAVVLVLYICNAIFKHLAS